MKQIYVLVCASLLLLSSLQGQVNLPYTLNFTSNQSFSGDKVWDGQGGTADMNGLNLEIYPTTLTDFNTPLTTFNMVWGANDYWSSGDNSFTGIGPDYGDNLGVPALVIKSDNTSKPFSLESMSLYDWGGITPWTISTYRNGSLIGSVEVNFEDVNYTPFIATQANILTPDYFQNVDEIRIVGPIGTKIFPAINQIALGAAITLPVTLKDFTGTQINNKVALTWQGMVEDGISRYEIQQSKDAKTFITVASVVPTGNGSSYKKEIALTGAGDYFRLRIVKTDNSSAFSKVINIKDKNYLSLSIHPNPASQYIYAATSKGGSAVIIDANGRRVRSVSLNQGSNQVDISGLASGLYYFVKDGQQQKFIKK